MRQPDLLAEHLLLDVPRREVVVVIETDLPYCPRERLRIDRLLHPARGVGGIGRERSGRMRVDADREPHLRPSRSDLLRLTQFRFIVRREDNERAAETRCAGTLDDLVEIGGEFRSRDVAVAIYQH